MKSVTQRQNAMRLPPVPKWNRTTDDLDSQDVLRGARDYERSLLPTDLIFPRTGQIWEAVRDCEVRYIAWIPKSVPSSGMARLQRGERVRILELDEPKPVYITFQPVRYHELHKSIVPRETRLRPGYFRYVLSLRLAYTVCCLREERQFFCDLFRLVEDVA
jgi:hypothetical protein